MHHFVITTIPLCWKNARYVIVIIIVIILIGSWKIKTLQFAVVSCYVAARLFAPKFVLRIRIIKLNKSEFLLSSTFYHRCVDVHPVNTVESQCSPIVRNKKNKHPCCVLTSGGWVVVFFHPHPIFTGGSHDRTNIATRCGQHRWNHVPLWKSTLSKIAVTVVYENTVVAIGIDRPSFTSAEKRHQPAEQLDVRDCKLSSVM